MDNARADNAAHKRTRRRSLAIGLLRAREAVMSHFRPILAQHDVTEQQWRVIRVLCETGILDASEVADKASVRAPSLTRIIRALEERGLIVKWRDEADGRRTLLEITDTGQSLFAKVLPENIRIYRQIDAKFGEKRTEMLLDLLDALADLKAWSQPFEVE